MKKQLDEFYQIDSKVMPIAGVRQQDFQENQTELIIKRLKDKFGFEKKNELILFSLGHFLAHRRCEDIIQALNLLIKQGFTNFKYIISGSKDFDPAYFSYIKNLIQELKLNSYIILDQGFKTNQEIIGYYQYCDIFLFVSVEQTWGLAPFEALMLEKPIIISQGVGCSEVFTNKQNALIVKEKSPPEIAGSINLLRNEELYYSLAKQGNNFVKENFTYDKISSELEEFLKSFT